MAAGTQLAESTASQATAPDRVSHVMYESGMLARRGGSIQPESGFVQSDDGGKGQSTAPRSETPEERAERKRQEMLIKEERRKVSENLSKRHRKRMPVDTSSPRSAARDGGREECTASSQAGEERGKTNTA